VAWWLATAAWAALIFHLSTPAFGADRSIPHFARLLAIFDLRVSYNTLRLLNSFIRTFAHLAEYSILALLLYRSRQGRCSLEWRPNLACWCIVIAFLYSLTDEYHQSFTSNRVASAFDCIIDTTGAMVGIGIVYLYVCSSGGKTIRPCEDLGASDHIVRPAGQADSRTPTLPFVRTLQ
jgi:VanZ family protein